MLKGLGKAPAFSPAFAYLQPWPKLPCYPICTTSAPQKWRTQLIVSIFLRHSSESCLAKMTEEQLEQTPPPKQLLHFKPCDPAAQRAEQEQLFKGSPWASAWPSASEQPRAFIWMNTNIPPNLNHSLSKAQVFTATKQTPVQLQVSAVPHAIRKVSGCRSGCIIGLIYSYQHGTWFESSITVTSHSGVCMLQRVSKLERNLPPAAEHYITINRKQAESSRRSPSLACRVMLMEMYTHSSICTYYGACQLWNYMARKTPGQGERQDKGKELQNVSRSTEISTLRWETEVGGF